jgi:alkanesulfonate monooxygenase SsuD/methylene tetrahydromethanopterin reductase-like flavin-dependent oxidoreductase (luciferase family)
MTQSRLNFQGEYYNFNNVPMEMEPYQKPYPPLWYPTDNPNSIP